jgi:arylsulfatase A-like enzyme
MKGVDLLRWTYQSYLRDYLACVRSLDDNIGRLLDHLEGTGLSRNTIVVYASDQGFYLGEHGWFDKRFMYDESLRTPFLVRWPGVVEPGAHNADLVSNLDFAQTFLDMAGVPAPETMQGRSLVPLLRGSRPDDWRAYHYYHYYEYPGWHMVQRHEGVTDGRFKLIHFYDLGEWELLDLVTDPHELSNQYHNPEYESIKRRLLAALERLKDQYEVPAGVPAARLGVDPMRYYSDQRRAIEEGPRAGVNPATESRPD